MNICVKHGHHLPLLVSYTYGLLYLYSKEICLNEFTLIWHSSCSHDAEFYVQELFIPFSTYKNTKLVQGILVKVKWSRYRPGVAQRVGRGIALLFHNRGTRMGWVVSSTPWLHFTPRKEPVRILQEAGWAPGPVWTGGKSRLHQDSIPEHPARSQSLYRLSYPAHTRHFGGTIKFMPHMYDSCELLILALFA